MKSKYAYWLKEQLILAGCTDLTEYNYGKFKDRNIRVTCNGEVQICDGDMDRWANSVGAGFFPVKGKFQRQFKNMLRDVDYD